MVDYPLELPLLKTPESISSCKYLGLAAISWRNRAGGTEPSLYPQEGMHVSQQFMPFMGAPPADRVVSGTYTAGDPDLTLLPAQPKIRYWLRNITYNLTLLNNLQWSYVWIALQCCQLNNPLYVVRCDNVRFRDHPDGSKTYLVKDLTQFNALDLVTTENTPVTVQGESCRADFYLRYNEVQVL